MTAIVFCPKCGLENSRGVKICRHCQTSLKFAFEHPDEVQSKNKKSYAEDWSIIRYLFGTFGFLAGAFWGFSLLIDSFIWPVICVGGIVGAFIGWFIGIILENLIDGFINYFHEKREKAK